MADAKRLLRLHPAGRFALLLRSIVRRLLALVGFARKPRPLLRGTVELANAVNAARPIGRKGYVTIAEFWFGWPTSEAPLVFLSASMLDAVRRGRRGDFAGPKGKVAEAMIALSWVILVAVYRKNLTTPGPALREALTDGLGENYRDTLAKLPMEPSRTGRPSAWVTTSSRRRYVNKQQIVRYGPHGRSNLADIWRRRDLPRDGKAPVLVQVPGGAWMLGWRRPQAYPLMNHLVDRGWICVSLNYRVSPVHTWPDHIVDIKRALAWVKEHIGEYGGDRDFVAITGGSAGGHLTALAALTPNEARFQPGFEDADTSVAAAVPFYGRYDWFTNEGDGRPEFEWFLQHMVIKKRLAKHRDIYLDASPITHVRPDAPPFFILHGEYDSLIPVHEGRDFYDELRKVSQNPVLYAEMPGAQHAFDVIHSPRAHQSAEAVGEFLSWVYASRLR